MLIFTVHPSTFNFFCSPVFMLKRDEKCSMKHSAASKRLSKNF